MVAQLTKCNNNSCLLELGQLAIHLMWWPT